MLLIGFCVPDNFIQVLERIADQIQGELVLVRDINELNTIDIIRPKCVIAFNAAGVFDDTIRIKAGANSVFAWFDDSNSERENVSDAGGNNEFYFDSNDKPEGFRDNLNLILQDRDLMNELKSKERVLSRLSLIHELTRTALRLNTEKEIREFVMNRLSVFYDAPSCTYLEYGRDDELYIVSQVTSDGVLRHGLYEKVADKRDYEECVKCGDPVINCRKGAKNEAGYFCAPLLSDEKTVGLIRIRYVSAKVDISVDRMVLRVAADILAAAKIRQYTNTALQESEQRAITILNTTVDAIITIDDRGSIQTFNQAAENLFGYTLQEVAGKNVHVLMPSPYKEEHDGYMKNYQQTGERQIIGIGREVTGRRKDGSMFPMYLAVSEYEVNGKQMFTGVVRDITEERQLEQEVMRISEHERHRIGQDLHDGLGQMLSGIGLLSRRVANKLETEKHALSDDMNEIRELIKEADDYSRGLAKGLVKIDLDRGGFSAAIEKLVRQSERLFRIDCELLASQDVDITERTRAEHVYRIVQEAVNNAVKHGQASEVKVSMIMGHNVLRISIKDNGTGFPKDWRSKEGLGVRIMEFRSRLIGAHFEQHNDADGGAIVTCSVPNP